MRKIYFSFIAALFLILSTANQASAQCSQNFDGVTAPALPAGWTAVTNTTCAGTQAWVTTSATSDNAPNSATTNDPNCISDEWLNSQVFPISSPTAQVTFRRSNNLENTFDGLVLEISIGAGPFQDILAAGGSFVTGGYNGTISVNFGSPIAGRQAWTGNTGGFVTTTVNLPASANGQNVVLRFRRATDSSVAGVGAFIDNIVVTGCSVPVVPCAENFDGVTAPALPANWIANFGATCATTVRWTTTSSTSSSAPNSATVNDPNCISDEYLDSRNFPIVSPTAQLTFQRSNNLENGFDGMVLEISIGGGPFQDILAAGGSFVTGGYNGTISVNFGSPIGGRQAWTGNSGGFVLTTVNLPASANGQNIVLRWRRASDSSVSGVGAFIDNVSIAGSNCAGGCAGMPIPGAIAGPATACGGNPVALTLSGHTTGAGISIQWKSATVSGGPYTNIPGATTANYNFTAAGGTTYYIATVTCTNGGASANTAQHTLLVGAPIHTAISSTVTTTCSPGAATVTATAANGAFSGLSVLGNSGVINLAIPDNTTVSSTISLPGVSFPAAADLRVRINARHSWVGDLRFALTTPCGTTLLFDRPGVPATGTGNSANLGTSNATTPPPAEYLFDLAGATVIPETAPGSGFIPAGTYRPSDVPGAAHSWAGLTFPCSGAGNWQLSITDNAGGDQGNLVSWQILGPAQYTHTMTGPGTITSNASTGPNNSTGNFTVTNLPGGVHTFNVTSTDGVGCSVTSSVNVTILATPVITFTPPAPVICNGQIQMITANVVPATLRSFNQPGTTVIPGGAPGVSSGPGAPYSSDLTVAGLPTTGVTVKSVKLGNFNHTFPDDVDVLLVSPTGQAVILMSDVGGGTDAIGLDYTLDDAGPAMSDAGANPQGTYRPTNFEAVDTWAPPVVGAPSATTLATFAGNPNGTWRLYVMDDAGGDVGYLGNWSITFNEPSLVVFTPNGPGSGLYSDALATIVYTGTPTTTVYARPSTTTVYTATSTVAGCTGSGTVTVTVNQLPTITVQPTPATQTICPGFNVSYSVTATGTALTYQWQKSTDNGATWTNLANTGLITGVTTNTLSMTSLVAANSGSYRVVVSGACTPAATSNAVVLNVATAPVISTQPANRTVCIGQTGSFTVAFAGSIPPPNIFQWQVSTDGGATWTNLTTNGSYTATYTTPVATAAMNNYRYRVLVTNFCGQTTTSAAAILTVNAAPTVTATALAQRICISDTLIPLVGSPVGGSWSGIGVSGMNFVPTATAVGTYTLTYTYTNPAGCTGTATVVAKVEDCQERLRLLSDDGVLLYPNPNNGRFNIRVNSTLYNYLGMKVYNAQGQLMNGKAVNDIMVSPVYTGLVYGRVIPVDLTNLPAGVYLVKLYYDDGVRTSEKTFKVVMTE
jgi:subtilisin-like proprotein convertase family protein